MEVGGYSAIIFDLFGTLVPAYRHEEVLGKMAAELGVDAPRFAVAFAEDTRDARETGHLTLSENLRAICASLGAAAGDGEIARAVAIRREFTRRSLSPRNGAVEVLIRLRDQGLALAVISDCCEVVAEAWETVPIAPHVDVAILSCRVGVRKPDPRTYRLAYGSMGVTAAACLYVGDGGSQELTGARGVGMDAVLLSVPEELGHDPYRPDAQEWDGPVVHSLDELRIT